MSRSVSTLTFVRNSDGIIVGQTLTLVVFPDQNNSPPISIPVPQPTELPLPNYSTLFPCYPPPPSFLTATTRPFRYVFSHSERRKEMFQERIGKVKFRL